jgi:hypothetical protein
MFFCLFFRCANTWNEARRLCGSGGVLPLLPLLRYLPYLLWLGILLVLLVLLGLLWLLGLYLYWLLLCRLSCWYNALANPIACTEANGGTDGLAGLFWVFPLRVRLLFRCGMLRLFVGFFCGDFFHNLPRSGSWSSSARPYS